MKSWLRPRLRKLKDAAHDAEDIVGEVERQVRAQMQRKLTDRVSSSISNIKMGPPIKEITEKLEEIKKRIPGKNHRTSSIKDESIEFGRETDREKVVGLSTSDGDSSAANLGGLGKTKLTLLANNDEHVEQHFEVAKESADNIILDDNFSTIVAAAKWGRSVYIDIQKFVQLQLTVIVVVLVVLIVNFCSACLTGNALLPAVQLLWVNMIMGTLGALALATEPPQDDLMKREPVRSTGSFISNVMWRNILGQSLFQFVVIWYLQTRGNWSFQLAGPDADLIPNTLIFNTFFFCQVFNQISSREMEKINVFKGMLKNYVFVGVLTSTVAFQVIIIEFLGDFANTTPLTSAQWFLSIFIGFLGMPIAAIIKLIPSSLQAWKAWKPSFSLYLPLSISLIELSIPFSLPLPFTPSLKLVLSRSPSLSFSFSTAQEATSSSSSASPSSSSPASLQCCPSSSQEPFVPLQHPHHLCNANLNHKRPSLTIAPTAAEIFVEMYKTPT